MRSALFTIFAAILVGCATRPDAIDGLVANLSPPHSSASPFRIYHSWDEGTFPILDVPTNASTDEVVERALQMSQFGGGVPGPKVSFKIMRVRVVREEGGNLPNQYTAVLIQTKFGEKIVLLKYENPGVGWWSRVFDVDASLQSKDR